MPFFGVDMESKSVVALLAHTDVSEGEEVEGELLFDFDRHLE